jgi:Putative peptidoglycan binding domain/L,D-transpeptidase catalytic domain
MVKTVSPGGTTPRRGANRAGRPGFRGSSRFPDSAPLRLVLGVAMLAAMLSVASAAKPLAAPAQAATTYVSSSYTAPHRGQTSSGVRALQLRLLKAKMLAPGYATGYFGPLTEAAVKKFQRTYKLPVTGKVDKATWNLLVGKTGTMKITTPTVKLDKRCKFSGQALCVDKTKRKLYYVKNSKIIKTLDARFGCAATPTRNGLFHVYSKRRHWVSTIYHTPMPFSMFFSGGQAVHYSADFHNRGYLGCSHGCVNIRNYSGLEWIFDRIHVGDRVVVYWS